MAWQGTSSGHPDLEMLHALTDGEAGPAGALHLARHLEGCERCRMARDRILRFQARLDALPIAEEPSDLVAQVMGRVRTLPPPKRRPRLLRLVAPAAAVLGSAVGLALLPVTGRVLRGFGRLLQPDLLEPSHMLDLLVGIAAAAAGIVGRAVDGLAPHAPTVPSFQGPHAPVLLLLFGALVALGIAASTVLMLALAGQGLLRHRASRIR